jgi:CubicO group peptidase (beta-lactamase class C family)
MRGEIFNMTTRLFLLLLVSLCISLSGFSQPEKAEAAIRSLMQETKVMGLSVAVVKKNRIIYTHSFGLKNMEANIPLTDDCLFRIASISKSFSATSIMQLVEAKKLSLEDDMSKLVGFQNTRKQSSR